MRILITGAMGGVGQALAVALAPRHDVTAVSHKQLDVTDMTAVLDIAHTVHPNVIINAAAMADVDACAQYPMRAWQVNALAPQFLANAATEVNAVLLHFSSDYVFSGEKGQPYVETDLTDPVNIYGESKVAGEQNALAHCRQTYIIRTAWVLNPYKKGFLNVLLDAAYSGVIALNGQTSSPTGIMDLVDAVALLITDNPPFGIYHVVNAGCCSRSELAREVFSLLNRNVIINELPAQIPSGTRRPMFSALLAERWKQQGLPAFRPWQNALAEIIAQ